MKFEQTFRFTKKAILQLGASDKIQTYHDTVARGLKLMIRPSGTKTFILYRKISGRPERVTLGRFPDLSIEQARAKADEFNSQIALGKNPAHSKRMLRAETTFEELFKLFIERYAKVHKRSWKNDEDRYRLYLQHWSQRKLSSIKRLDVQRLHEKIGANCGIYAANRTLSLLKTLFNKAIEWGWDYPNPVHAIKKFKEKSRERFLQTDELPRLFESLADEPNGIARDYILVSLLTGARKSNVLAMRWEQINFAQATWTIPETKTGDPHTVPLVKAAMNILNCRREKSSDPWVFPGSGKTGHLVEPKKAWKRILERAGIEDLRLHDLRRSLGSWQAATGANLSIIGKTLAHKNLNTTAIYARLNLEPVRQSMDVATDAILEAANWSHPDSPS